MEAMTDGINAADSIEVYFKLGNTDYTFKHTGSVPPDGRYYDLPYDFSKPSSSDVDGFDPAEEAGRCLRCNCSKCYDVCPLMQTDGRYPKKMCTEYRNDTEAQCHQTSGCAHDRQLHLLRKMQRSLS